MSILEILFAFLLALLFSGLIIGIFGRRGPGPAGGFLFFFILLFLVVWASSFWVTPAGPYLWDVPWLTLLFVALVVVFLIAALTPPAPSGRVPPAETTTSEAVALAFGVFFWILIFLLIIFIVLGFTIT